jgi:hypothetical protein
VGQRGDDRQPRKNKPFCEKELSYIRAVKKAMDNPIVGEAIRVAMRQHLAQGGNEHTAWTATGITPHSVPHPEPFIAGIPDNITPNLAGRISDYEKRADRAGLVGVPGLEIIELYRHVAAGRDNLELLRHLASLAIKKAVYINADATLEQVEQAITKPIELEEWYAKWSTIKEYASAWAPKEDPLPLSLSRL